MFFHRFVYWVTESSSISDKVEICFDFRNTKQNCLKKWISMRLSVHKLVDKQRTSFYCPLSNVQCSLRAYENIINCLEFQFPWVGVYIKNGKSLNLMSWSILSLKKLQQGRFFVKIIFKGTSYYFFGWLLIRYGCQNYWFVGN